MFRSCRFPYIKLSFIHEAGPMSLKPPWEKNGCQCGPPGSLGTGSELHPDSSRPQDGLHDSDVLSSAPAPGHWLPHRQAQTPRHGVGRRRHRGRARRMRGRLCICEVRGQDFAADTQAQYDWGETPPPPLLLPPQRHTPHTAACFSPPSLPLSLFPSPSS